MKKLPSLITLAILGVFLCVPALAAESRIAVPSTQTVLVDGTAVTFETYALLDANGYMTNYAKLRDVAQVLNGTKAQFSVDWSATRGIYVQTGKPYKANGSEMHTPYTGNRTYTPGVSTTDVNASAVALDAIVLNDDTGGGYTYYKLRDLGQALGFVVDWNAETGVTISTGGNLPTDQTALQEKRELNAEDVYAKCSNSVVYIEALNSRGNISKTGSGFFIDSMGTLVTNYHVIDGTYNATATLPDGTKYNIEGAYDFSEEQDWAVLKIAGNNPSYLKIGDSDTIVGGASVFTLGSPLGMQDTISSGLISNANRIDDGVKYIQTSAAISSGSSGGALINKYGDVIGITSASYADGQNINLALPLDFLSSYRKSSIKTLTAIVENEFSLIQPYSLFPDIPDFGKYYGVETLNTESVGDTTYMYYRIADIESRGSWRGSGEKNYERILGEWGAVKEENFFEKPYIYKAELHTTKNAYEIKIGYVDTATSEKAVAVVIRRLLSQGKVIGFEKWPTVPDFGAYFGLSENEGYDLFAKSVRSNTSYYYPLDEFMSKGNIEINFSLYMDLLEEWGFHYDNTFQNAFGVTFYEFFNSDESISVRYALDQEFKTIDVFVAIHRVVDSKTMHLSQSRITIENALPKIVTVTATFSDGNIFYSVDDENVVECSWGEWDGDNINLFITGLRNGKTSILISNDVNDDFVEIEVSVNIP